MLSTNIATTHDGVGISYRESDDQWIFELGGRERTAKTLREARQVIDNAPKPKKAVTRFQAYLVGWSANTIDEVTVGAFSKDHRGDPQFWISNNGTRSKERASQLMKVNDHNNALVADWVMLTEQIEQLTKERSLKVAAMERVDVPVE